MLVSLKKMKRRTEFKHLRTDCIIDTVVKLKQRLEKRFPKASLTKLCDDLVIVSRLAQQRADDFRKPLIALRILSAAFVIGILIGTGAVITALRNDTAELELLEFIQVLEAGMNDVVLIGAAIFFVVTLEVRAKRNRALEAIHELRSIAHIIDMHQLTKDPLYVVTEGRVHSRESDRPMTPFELSRYLDYCSEMLSLCGKVAAVYVQEFSDSVVIAAVNEIEDLTTGLSRKIWQKVLILEQQTKREFPIEESQPTYGDERDSIMSLPSQRGSAQDKEKPSSIIQPR